MVNSIYYCPVSLPIMLAEANNPASYARRSSVRAAWFVGRLSNQIANDREAIACLQRYGFDDDALNISIKWTRIARCEAAIKLLAGAG